ncbi:MAG: RsmE family RNA methyltransferase [Fimbriimonadaceae bacterium]|nr:RsmE family RNA methyltransferase [Fimbriimonadaceae bacterium]
MTPGRELPRVFILGATPDAEIELPASEVTKFRQVLRLESGDMIGVLPGDGTMIRAKFVGRHAEPVDVIRPDTEANCRLRIAQSLPKADKLEEVVRAGTELGVAAFTFFVSDRTIVKWDGAKQAEKLKRLGAIAREAAEVSFRTRIPALTFAGTFAEAWRAWPDAYALSESELAVATLSGLYGQAEVTLFVGPEGGWSPRELVAIGARGITLGPRILRTEHAASAAAAFLLLER